MSNLTEQVKLYIVNRIGIISSNTYDFQNDQRIKGRSIATGVGLCNNINIIHHL